MEKEYKIKLVKDKLSDLSPKIKEELEESKFSNKEFIIKNNLMKDDKVTGYLFEDLNESEKSMIIQDYVNSLQKPAAASSSYNSNNIQCNTKGKIQSNNPLYLELDDFLTRIEYYEPGIFRLGEEEYWKFFKALQNTSDTKEFFKFFKDFINKCEGIRNYYESFEKLLNYPKFSKQLETYKKLKFDFTNKQLFEELDDLQKTFKDIITREGALDDIKRKITQGEKIYSFRVGLEKKYEDFFKFIDSNKFKEAFNVLLNYIKKMALNLIGMSFQILEKKMEQLLNFQKQIETNKDIGIFMQNFLLQDYKIFKTVMEIKKSDYNNYYQKKYEQEWLYIKNRFDFIRNFILDLIRDIRTLGDFMTRINIHVQNQGIYFVNKFLKIREDTKKIQTLEELKTLRFIQNLVLKDAKSVNLQQLLTYLNIGNVEITFKRLTREEQFKYEEIYKKSLQDWDYFRKMEQINQLTTNTINEREIYIKQLLEDIEKVRKFVSLEKGKETQTNKIKEIETSFSDILITTTEPEPKIHIKKDFQIVKKMFSPGDEIDILLKKISEFDLDKGIDNYMNNVILKAQTQEKLEEIIKDLSDDYIIYESILENFDSFCVFEQVKEKFDIVDYNDSEKAELKTMYKVLIEKGNYLSRLKEVFSLIVLKAFQRDIFKKIKYIES